MIEPLKLINALKKTDRYIESIYTEGGCYRFHLFLKTVYPSATALINKKKNHVVSKIGEGLFDITGVVEGEYFRLSKEDIKMVCGWSFHKQMLIQISECPYCEEPIVF